jgi:PKD repeat protein
MKTKLILLISLLISFQIGKSQFTTDFTADVTEGCAPLQVTFTPSSNIPSPTNWLWIFGDGSISSMISGQDSTVHTYVVTYTYTVTLIISNGTDSDTVIKPNYITVYPKPTVDFTHTMNGDTVQFIDQSPSLIAQWNWDLGNGTTSNLANPITNYPYPPDSCYDVSLTVTNAYNCIDSLTKYDYICIDSTTS